MYKIHKLKNGLTIIGEEIPYLKSITCGVWVNAGSRIEDEKISGISHFIEHMLFKGTKNKTSKQIANLIDNVGGQINAFTSKECTCYYVKLLDEHINIGIDILSDMMINPIFDQNDIDKERSVILEELKMYEDSPEDLVYDLLMENVYKGDGLGANIAGTSESLQNINQSELFEYFKKYYVPNNAVISVSGNLKFDEMINLLEEYFGKWEFNEINVDITTPVFNKCTVKKNKDTEQVSLCILLEGIELENRNEIVTLSVISNILGGSMSSRLFQKIREELGLVYSIYSSPSSHRKAGDLGIFASMSKENLEIVYKLIIEEIDDIKKNYLTDEEIMISKEQIKGAFILGLESTSSRMMGMGKSLLLEDKVYTAEEILDQLNSVDKNIVKTVIDKVFNKEKLAVSVVGKDVEDIIF